MLRFAALATACSVLALATDRGGRPGHRVGLVFPPLRVSVWVLPVAAALTLGLGTSDVLWARADLAGVVEDGGLQRVLVYDSFLQMIADRPLLGVGPGAFAGVYETSYRMPGSSNDPETFTAENVLLSTAAQLGVPAALVLLAALVLAATQGWRVPDTEDPDRWAGLTPRALAAGSQPLPDRRDGPEHGLRRPGSVALLASGGIRRHGRAGRHPSVGRAGQGESVCRGLAGCQEGLRGWSP